MGVVKCAKGDLRIFITNTAVFVINLLQKKYKFRRFRNNLP